ncbi:copper chaperone PCu(A)C [Propionibacteriaceae bacterium G57]|uniref:copper chaperone PCu(A)C n=1 Tax=Aestuariimicrobium sp. G57 TaxID=3418485 RepID=UPI003DA71F1E
MIRRGFLRLALGGAALTAAGSLAACGSDEPSGTPTETPKIIVSQPWVRTTDGAKDVTMSAAFMDLANPSDKPVALVKASCEVATSTELHEMATVEGKKVMRQVESVIIEPGSHRHLVSGGNHIMLMGLTKALPIGDEVTLTLEFDNGQVETVKAMVKEFTEEEDHYHTPSGSPTP